MAYPDVYPEIQTILALIVATFVVAAAHTVAVHKWELTTYVRWGTFILAGAIVNLIVVQIPPEIWLRVLLSVLVGLFTVIGVEEWYMKRCAKNESIDTVANEARNVVKSFNDQ